jgi:Ser/Thr protein kinase RdoA (MazF antagonist)
MMRGTERSSDPFLAGLRQTAAVQAAVEVARRYGAGHDGGRVVRDTNNTIVRLAPERLIAKVALTAGNQHAARALLRELRIAQYLARNGAPVASPSQRLPGRVHLEGRFAMTFWEDHPQREPSGPIDVAEAARSLAELHAVLATYPAPLDSFTRDVETMGAVLADGGSLPALPARDRLLLQTVHAHLRARLARREPAEVALHGDPSPANLLVTGEGYLWIDLETACRGPAEWDLTALPGHGEGVFGNVDGALLETLGDLRGVSRVVRAWLHPGQAELDEASRAHLARLRARYPSAL